MRAAVVEEPGRLTVRDVPVPELGEYDALCELLYGATCSGTDTHILHGRLPWHIDYPTIVGHESVGRVVKLGPKVRNFREGDLITRVGALPTPGLNVTWGGFAQYGVARDHEAAKADGRPEAEWSGFRWNKVVPPDVDPRAATLIITWRETLSYLQRMGFREGASLLVLGSGGNGLAFASHGRNLGASRVTVVGSLRRADEARAAGAGRLVDYACANPVAALREGCPNGYDFAVDAVGKRGNLDIALGALAPGGRVGLYGIDDFGACYLDPGKARGSFTFCNEGYDEAETHDQVLGHLRAGRLDARAWLDLDSPYPLERIADAFTAIADRRAVKALVALRG